ncbi:hypothetical protein ABH940_004886 [Streptacidiphilus sp. BW17]
MDDVDALNDMDDMDEFGGFPPTHPRRTPDCVV